MKLVFHPSCKYWEGLCRLKNSGRSLTEQKRQPNPVAPNGRRRSLTEPPAVQALGHFAAALRPKLAFGFDADRLIRSASVSGGSTSTSSNISVSGARSAGVTADGGI
jgi:hypothetical protein